MRVTINIYDVQRNCNQKGGDMFGLGIYHTGIVIQGSEYHYGGNTLSRASGIYTTPPQMNPNFMFKYSIELGPIPAKALRANEAKLKGRPNDPSAFDDSRIVFGRDIQPILYELQDQFRAYKYHLLLNNCNHFADAFVRRLYANQQGLPGWVNRIAFIGSFFHCVVPFNYVTVGTPEGQEKDTQDRIAQWRKEDDAKYEAQKASQSYFGSLRSWWNGSGDVKAQPPRGRTLSELATRETEVDTSRDSVRSDSSSGFFSSFYSSLMVRPETAVPNHDREEKTMDTTMNDDDDEDEMIGSQYRSELSSCRAETELAISSPRARLEKDGNDSDEIEEENSPLKSRGDSRVPLTQPIKRKGLDPSVLKQAAAARMARAAQRGEHSALPQADVADMEAEGGESGSSLLSYLNPISYFRQASSTSNDKLANADKNSDEGSAN